VRSSNLEYWADQAVHALTKMRDEVLLLQTELEDERRANVALTETLNRIATDYYHDRHAQWAREALR